MGALSLLIGCLIGAPNMRLIFFSLMTVSWGFAVAQFATLNASVDLLQKRVFHRARSYHQQCVRDRARGAAHPSRRASHTLSCSADPIAHSAFCEGLSLEDLNALIPGQRISVTAMLRPPPAPHLPGSYDFQRRAFFADIGAYGFSIGAIETLRIAERGVTQRVAQYIHALRAEIATRARVNAPDPLVPSRPRC